MAFIRRWEDQDETKVKKKKQRDPQGDTKYTIERAERRRAMVWKRQEGKTGKRVWGVSLFRCALSTHQDLKQQTE